MGAPTALQPGTPPQNLSSLDDFLRPGVSRPAQRHSAAASGAGHSQRQLSRQPYRRRFSGSGVVNNWDPGDPVPGKAVQGKFRYHNTHVFDPWQDIEVSMGYYRQGKDNLQQMLVGEITTMSPNFPQTGYSTLTVRALSFLHQFRTQQKTLQFRNMTDSEIAKKIVDDINTDLKKKLTKITLQMLQQEVDDNKTLNSEISIAFLEMHNQFPIVFLMQRARDIGYDISIDDEVDDSGMRIITFHYRSSASGLAPQLRAGVGQIADQLSAHFADRRQVNSVTVTGWNVQTKQAITQTVTRADLVKSGEKVVAPEDLGVTENTLSQKIEVVVDRGFRDPNEAKKVARENSAATGARLRRGQG